MSARTMESVTMTPTKDPVSVAKATMVGCLYLLYFDNIFNLKETTASWVSVLPLPVLTETADLMRPRPQVSPVSAMQGSQADCVTSLSPL